MNKKGINDRSKGEDTIINFNGKMVKDNRIPGLQALADNVAHASESGTLFFLAVELDLLLRDYLTKNELAPTAIDLEMMIAQAAKALMGE